MKRILSLFALICSIALPGQALATTIALYPSQIIPQIGDSADVGLWIDGLTSGGPNSLGAFDLEITFDDSIVTFESVTFFGNLGEPDLDQGPGLTPPFETDIYVDTSTLGTVRLMETSLLFDFELDGLQASVFLLARLKFNGKKVGFNTLGLQNVVVSDAFGIQLLNPELEGARLDVVIPEPSTLLLLGSGLVGFFALLLRYSPRNSERGLSFQFIRCYNYV